MLSAADSGLLDHETCFLVAWLLFGCFVQSSNNSELEFAGLQCSSTATAAEIKDEHWYVADQPKAPGKLQFTAPCMFRYNVMLCQHVVIHYMMCVFLGFCLQLCCTCVHCLFLLNCLAAKCSTEQSSSLVKYYHNDIHCLHHQMSGVAMRQGVGVPCRHYHKISSALPAILSNGI